jgi:hypothetical protein
MGWSMGIPQESGPLQSNAEMAPELSQESFLANLSEFIIYL